MWFPSVLQSLTLRSMESSNAEVFWNKNGSIGPKSAVEHFLIFSHQTAKGEKRDAFAKSSAYIVLRNLMEGLRSPQINCSQILTGFLLFVGYEDVMNEFEREDRSGYCKSPSVRTAEQGL